MIDREKSDTKDIKYGIPKVSVLGQLPKLRALFNVNYWRAEHQGEGSDIDVSVQTDHKVLPPTICRSSSWRRHRFILRRKPIPSSTSHATFRHTSSASNKSTQDRSQEY